VAETRDAHVLTFLIGVVALALSTPGCAESPAGAASHSIADLLAGCFRCQVREPLVSPATCPDDTYYSIGDPSIVSYEGRWHLFCTVRGQERSHQIEYLSFPDWSSVGETDRTMLTMHDGFYCAPQVFYFAPQQRWYLICQASDEACEPKYGAAYATTTDIADADSWRSLQPLGSKPASGKAGLDFWIMCDDEKAHLFLTTLDGRM
jgi:hypothetical protein